MEITTYLINTAAFLCVLFGFYILKLDIKSSLYRVFFVLCIIISITVFTAGMMYTAVNKETLVFWDHTHFIIVVICWAVNLHFYILLTEHKIKNPHILLIYLPAVIIIYIDFTSSHIVSDYVKCGTRWKFIYATNYYFYIIYSISYAVIDMLLVYRWGKRSNFRKQKLQAKTILSFVIALWVICIITDYILPHFDFYKFPPAGSIGRIFYAFILWYSFVKYRFLKQPSLLLPEIVLNIQEAVALLDKDVKIIICNDKFKALLKSIGKDFKGCCLFDYIEGSNEFKYQINKVISGEFDNSRSILNYKTESDSVSTTTYITRVTDKFGDLTGILLVSNENKGIKQFQERYRLSGRQMEIIDLCLSGNSNAEISDILAISKKTTEAHFFNIYNKLGVDNKIELYNIAAEFNIIPKKTGIETAKGRDFPGKRHIPE